MTLGQKLQALRKRHGWTQEELAEKLAVSRQALSKWESDAVIPGTENIIQLSKLFHVPTDYLLMEDREECDSPSGSGGKIRVVIGVCIAGISLLGLLVIGILSSVFQEVYIEKPADAEWVRAYAGLPGFLKVYHLEWLFILCIILLVCGVFLIFRPQFEKLFYRLSTFCAKAKVFFGRGKGIK